MKLATEPWILYQALCARDARFDGQFFVGVTSTKIYCRPICRARTPLLRNCYFFACAAAAEAAGFRPCLRCRPELAPGLSLMESSTQLAQAAARLIEADFLNEYHTLENLAARIGVTPRHLRRIFVAEFGISLIHYVQTRRLLWAKQLLSDTQLTIADIAEMSGFGSKRRLYALFQNRYQRSPSAFRKSITLHNNNTATNPTAQSLDFALSYRPPYAWSAQFAFMEKRALQQVEWVCLQKKLYTRTVYLCLHGKIYQGWLTAKAAPDQNVLQVSLSKDLAPIAALLLHKIRHVFDLNCQPDLIGQKLGYLGQNEPGLRIPGAFDGFEIAVRTILGQRISVAAATALANRCVERWGIELFPSVPNHPLLCRSFPSAAVFAAISSEELTRIGIPLSRAKTIHALAQAVHTKALCLDTPPIGSNTEAIKILENIPGIGPWTIQYIALRVWGWPDTFPESDGGIRRALGQVSAQEAHQLAEKWRPWRSYAVMYLWRSLQKPNPSTLF